MSIESEVLAKTLHENATLTAEIKRLEAENADLKSTISAYEEGTEDAAYEANQTIEKLRARITLLEAALQLPEGCDVFQIERAMKEGAVDGDGGMWKFSTYIDRHPRFLKEGTTFGCSFDDNGVSLMIYSFPQIRLYCRKEANK